MNRHLHKCRRARIRPNHQIKWQPHHSNNSHNSMALHITQPRHLQSFHSHRILRHTGRYQLNLHAIGIFFYNLAICRLLFFCSTEQVQILHQNGLPSVGSSSTSLHQSTTVHVPSAMSTSLHSGTSGKFSLSDFFSSPMQIHHLFNDLFFMLSRKSSRNGFRHKQYNVEQYIIIVTNHLLIHTTSAQIRSQIECNAVCTTFFFFLAVVIFGVIARLT